MHSNQSLVARATLYPKYFTNLNEFSSPLIASKLLNITDAKSLIRPDNWKSGVSDHIPFYSKHVCNSDIQQTIQELESNPSIENLQRLLESNDKDFQYMYGP